MERMGVFHILLFLIVVAAIHSGFYTPLVHAAGPTRATQYTLGRGLTIGNTGLNIGGYANFQYEDLRDDARRFSVNTLSSQISWDFLSRARFFAEIELEDILLAQDGRRLRSRGDPLEVERAYIDLFASDALVGRIGKFLTPVGRWNEIHAAPLVWTTSRPSVTSQTFAENTTGGMLHGVLTPFGYELEYAAYAALPDGLDPDEEEGASEFEETVGLRVRSRLGDVQFGASYTNFVKEREFELEYECEEEEGDEEGECEEEIEIESRENLLGLDFFWFRNQYELSGEFVYSFGSKGIDNKEWGLFIQGVVPLGATALGATPLAYYLTRHLYGVGRYEYFDPSGGVQGAHVWTFGLAYRPIHALILKAEYSVAHDNVAEVPEGFAASIAALF